MSDMEGITGADAAKEPAAGPAAPVKSHFRPNTVLLEIQMQQFDMTSPLHKVGSPFVRVRFGGGSKATVAAQALPDSAKWRWARPEILCLQLTEHDLRFGTLQFNAHDSSVIFGSDLISRAELRLAEIARGIPVSPTKTHIPMTLNLPMYDLLDAALATSTVSTATQMSSPTAMQSPIAAQYIQREPKSTLQVLLTFIVSKTENDNGESRKSGETYKTINNPNLTALPKNSVDQSALVPGFLDSVLASALLSKTTRETLQGLYRIISMFNQGLEWMSPQHWLFGMLLLNRFHESLPCISEIVQPELVEDPNHLASTIYMHKYALAVYGWKGLLYFGKVATVGDKRSIKQFLPHIREQDWLRSTLGSAQSMQPSYIIVYDCQDNEIIVSIRGTMSSADAATDLLCEYVDFPQTPTSQEPSSGNGVVAHRGILEASQYLLSDTIDSVLVPAIAKLKPKRLRFIGHSLGGGIAAVATILIHKSPTLIEKLEEGSPGLEILCTSFAPPPVVSLSLALWSRPWVSSYINRNDIVPRLSYGSVMDLRACLIVAVLQSSAHMSDAWRLLRKKNDAKWEAQFTAINKQRIENKSRDMNPKLFIAGTVYYVTKTTKKLSATKSTGFLSVPPSANSTMSPSAELSAAKDKNNDIKLWLRGSIAGVTGLNSDILKNVSSPSTSTSSKTKSSTTLSSVPYIQSDAASIGFSEEDEVDAKTGKKEKFYAMYRVSTQHFDEIFYRGGMFADHMPGSYDTALRNTLKSITSPIDLAAEI